MGERMLVECNQWGHLGFLNDQPEVPELLEWSTKSASTISKWSISLSLDHRTLHRRKLDVPKVYDHGTKLDYFSNNNAHIIHIMDINSCHVKIIYAKLIF